MNSFVSIVTPTYNRRKYIPTLIKIYALQTYSKARMEWIILDDGTDKVGDLFKEASKTIPNIRYIALDEKALIGKKRNILNKEAKGDIIISMDDDDYYPESRVMHVVSKFAQFPRIDLAGSSEMYLFYTYDKKIVKAGPYNPNHSTNGALAVRKSYAKTHQYDETVTHAEERSFLDDYKHPMIQLDPFKTILVLCHTDNTFDKSKIRHSGNKLITETTYSLKSFISDKKLREFYMNA